MQGGYFVVSVNKKNLFVHRIVATIFLENFNKRAVVNHIDGNKQNNNVNNLEWVTHKENNIHAIATGLKGKTDSRGKKIVQLKDNIIVSIYPSINKASRNIGISPATILHSCRNHSIPRCGFTFKFLDNDDAFIPLKSKPILLNKNYEQKRFNSVSEVANYLQVSPGYVYKALKYKKLIKDYILTRE